jgi:hypothetical protein
MQSMYQCNITLNRKIESCNLFLIFLNIFFIEYFVYLYPQIQMIIVHIACCTGVILGDIMVEGALGVTTLFLLDSEDIPLGGTITVVGLAI